VSCAPGGPSTFLATSKGLCRECRQLCEVRYLAAEGGVFLERYCPTHGTSRAMVAESFAWYLDALQAPAAPRLPPKVIRRTAECPQSCGPCEAHGQACHLPVFSITNACNLRCPICFTYNRPDCAYFMSAEEFSRHLDFVLEATGGVDLINITGGEPTLHPKLLELLALAKRPGIGRVTVNTNGLTLAKHPDLAKALADLGAYVILSLDTLKPERSVAIHGRDICDDKKRALDNLARANVQTTLLMVLVGGVNEDELETLLSLTLGREHVRSLTIQTMTYTGQGGGSFGPRKHLPIDAVERRIEAASGGRILQRDFMPLPGAHPLCYGVTYLLVNAPGSALPFTRVLDKKTLARHLEDGYLLHPSAELERSLRAAIDHLWSEGGNEEVLSALKQMLRRVYPTDEKLSVHARQQRAEQSVKTVYVHGHMDEDTFEVGRAMRCPDQVPENAERLVGACSYNLFYRQKDPRFWEAPCPPRP